jgi:hypothetical protein
MEDERRLVGRVLRHWTKTVHARGFPRHDEIDPWMLGEDWENCLMIAVEEPVELSHFVSVGKNLAVALCSSTSLAGVLLSRLPRVLLERRCLIIEGSATLHGARIPHRSALLPCPRVGSRSAMSSAPPVIVHSRLTKRGGERLLKRGGYSAQGVTHPLEVERVPPEAS